MQSTNERGRVSLTECKKVLSKKGKHYTDAEILAIRDWLYLLAEITLSEFDKTDHQTNQQNKAA